MSNYIKISLLLLLLVAIATFVLVPPKKLVAQGTTTFTPNLGLALPPHGIQNWDVPLRNNFSIIDSSVANFATKPTSDCSDPNTGKVVFSQASNSYICAVDQTGAGGGGGITSLNGATNSTQTFAVPTFGGTAPNWSTNTSTGAHTLNIPMADTNGTITAGLLSNAELAKAYRRSLNWLEGSDSPGAPVLADTDDQPTVWRNNYSGNFVVDGVWCQTDTGTPTINVLKNNGSTTVSLVAGATCTCSAAGNNCSISTTPANMVFAPGDRLDFAILTAGGAAHRISLNVAGSQ